MVPKLFFFIFGLFFFVASCLAADVQTGQIMRSEELGAKQERILERLNAPRQYRFENYSVSGVELVPDQKAVLDKIIKPLFGQFLTKGEVDGLCQAVRNFLHQEVKTNALISFSIVKEELRIEARRP